MVDTLPPSHTHTHVQGGNYDIVRNTTDIVDTPPHVQRGVITIYIPFLDLIQSLFCFALSLFEIQRSLPFIEDSC